jgi:hypothetical protein
MYRAVIPNVEHWGGGCSLRGHSQQHTVLQGAPAQATRGKNQPQPSLRRVLSARPNHHWSTQQSDRCVHRPLHLPPGDFLWELIHPKDPKDGSHIKPPSGKYKVRLYIMVRGGGHWRS